jgi:hypothetical protein
MGCGVGVREGGLEVLVWLLLWPLVLVLYGAPEMVVVRRLELLSSSSMREGGGGSGARTEARQRKHSPVPKYLGAGWGWSER